MEHHVWSSCEQSLIDANKPLSYQTLASTRSLIINPHTSTSTISSIIETLTRSLSTYNSLTRPHILKLLTDIASRRPSFSPLIFKSINSTVLDFESLVAVAAISEQNRNLKFELDDSLFVSMCFSCSVSERLWLLRNAEKLCVQVQVLLTVFLGFTKDPYPFVRKEALNGLVRLCKDWIFIEDKIVIKGGFCRGFELLKDSDDSVRSAAVDVVGEWGLMLIAAVDREADKIDWSDTVFLELCSMVRDMSVGVRIRAFDALSKIQTISEDVLIQTLSKKVLPIMKEKKKYRIHHAGEKFEGVVSSAAGAFVHGLEDEFFEVRKSACYSLCKLVIVSAQFAAMALNLLMDMLNDSSMVVRLEALQTLHRMATSDCLIMQEMHMHMFLGILLDNNDTIRSAAREVYKLAKLPSLELYRLCIDGLLENLDLYPQDETDVFSVLFYMGRNHTDFTTSIIKDVSHEIEPDCNGNMNLDSARVAAFLVLSISAPLSHDQNGQSIPPRFFSYAATLLGRISFALRDVVDQNTILAYITQSSRTRMEVEGKETCPPVVNATLATNTGSDADKSVVVPLMQVGNENFETLPMIIESGDIGTSTGECQLEEHVEMRNSVNLIFTEVKGIWVLVQSNCSAAALKILRACKENLAMLTPALPGCTGVLAFLSRYLKVIKLLAKIWGHVVSKVQSYEIGMLEILLSKLERILREMRCRFIGFSKREESHLLELTLVTCILRLSKVEICSLGSTLKRLSTSVSRLDFLWKEGYIELSDFAIKVKKILDEINTSVDSVPCSRFVFLELVDHYSVEHLSLPTEVRYLDASLDVPGNDFEKPFFFVSGLPVAIPSVVTLHNVLNETRLWLRMAIGEETVQYIFIDTNNIEGSNEVRKFTFVAPFCKTPKTHSFTLRVCIGVECMFEDIHSFKICGGPEHPLVNICPETEVYLCMRHT